MVKIRTRKNDRGNNSDSRPADRIQGQNNMAHMRSVCGATSVLLLSLWSCCVCFASTAEVNGCCCIVGRRPRHSFAASLMSGLHVQRHGAATAGYMYVGWTLPVYIDMHIQHISSILCGRLFVCGHQRSLHRCRSCVWCCNIHTSTAQARHTPFSGAAATIGHHMRISSALSGGCEF